MSNHNPTSIPFTPEIPMVDLNGLSIPELCQKWLELQNELISLDADHNETGRFESPLLTRQYKHLRQPLEARASALKEALYPYYLADCRADRAEAERLNMVGLVVGSGV